jgi:ribosomal protein L32
MGDLVETVGEDAAQHFRRKLDEAGTLRVRAGELMSAFGFTDMAPETRESVADMLWEAGLRTEPSLGSSRIRRRSKLKLMPANAGLVETRYAINPVGTVMAVVGGLLFALASFLPLDEPGGAFARVQSNSLIQHSEWWLLIVGAAIVVVALRSYTSGQRKQATSVLVLSVIAVGMAIYVAQNTGLRTLYPIGLSGEPEETGAGTVVPLGIAIYVAGAGALLALLGGWTMRRTAEIVTAAEDEATQRCPDCAETILAAARVCKHCGYRLDGP